jgi:hypothetical protein
MQRETPTEKAKAPFAILHCVQPMYNPLKVVALVVSQEYSRIVEDPTANLYLLPSSIRRLKFVTVGLTGATGGTLYITGVTQNEPVNGTGDGDTGPDAAWVSGVRDKVQLRAERSGTGAGRLYRVAYSVDGKDGKCDGAVFVSVPHDQGKGSVAVDPASVSVNSFGS